MVFAKCGRGRKPRSKEDTIKIMKDKLKEICNGISIGLTVNDACRAAGIGAYTLYKWQEKAKNDPDLDFFEEAIEEARAKGERMLAGRIVGHSEKDWRAAAWILERRHNERWGVPKDPVVQINSENIEKVENINAMTAEEKQAMLDKLEEEYRKEKRKNEKK